MKIFDLQVRGWSYHFKVWDNELPQWKELRREFDWKLAIAPRNRWDVLRDVQIDAANKATFDALTDQLHSLSDVEFEGGIRLSRPAAKRPPSPKPAARAVKSKSQADKPRSRRSKGK